MTSQMLTYRGHVKAVLGLGLPLIGGHMVQFAIGLTDTVMLGWYSIEALAAVVLGSTFFFTSFILGNGFAIAVMPMVAEADAQGFQPQIRRVTRMGMWLSAAYAILLLPVFWWSGDILQAIGQDPILAQTAQSYLRVVGIGMLPALIAAVIKGYLAGLGYTRVVFWVTVLAALVNAVVNYILIFGNFGAPEMGVLGAAIASLSVQVVTMIGVAIYAVRKLPENALFQRIWRPDVDVLRAVFSLGVPAGITSLLEASLFAMSATMMGWLGTVSLAAHGIAVNIAGMTFMMHLGLSNAATIRVGSALGRRDYDHLARGAHVTTLMSLGLSVFTVSAFLLFPEQLISLFLDPGHEEFDAIMKVGVTLIYLAALFQFVDGLQAIALGLLRGVMDTTWPMIMAAISYWGIGAVSSYVLGFVFGLEGVGIWLGLVAGLAFAALLLMWRFWRYKLVALRRAA